MSPRNSLRDRLIYERRRSGARYTEIGAEFGLTAATCSGVVTRLLWRELDFTMDIPKGWLPKLETCRELHRQIEALVKLGDFGWKLNWPYSESCIERALSLGRSYWESDHPKITDKADLMELLYRSVLLSKNEQYAREWLAGDELREFMRVRVLEGHACVEERRKWLERNARERDDMAREQAKRFAIQEADYQAAMRRLGFVGVRIDLSVKPMSDEEISASSDIGPNNELFIRWK